MSENPRRTRLMQVLHGIAIVVLTLVVSISVVESVLRRFPRFQPVRRWYVGEYDPRASTNFEPDSATGWRMKPNRSFVWRISANWSTYTSNAQGARSPFDFTEACRRPRIVLVGDSFFFGTGVAYDETVGAQLADSLAHSVDVYDLAMPGFGLDQIWMSLRYKALSLCPTLLVAGFIDDDWSRSMTAYRWPEGMTKPTFLLDGDSLRRQTVADRPGALARWLNQRSSTWRLLQGASRRLAYRAGDGEWWRLNIAIIGSMVRDASAAGVPILFVRLPVNGANRSFPALRRRIERIRASYVDLAEPSAAPSDIYLANDPHLSARGNAFVAGAILGWIRMAGPARIKSAVQR